jgi:hypothetical protein
MKKAKLIFALTLLNCSVFAQGWVGNSTSNSLYSVNANLNLNPVSIGIGTNNPTEQLHTTLGVRFEGITQNNRLARILAQDNNGKLFWRDAATLITPPNNNFWSLVGNASTNPGTGVGQNYLGTTDTRRVVFATNAIERMTILPNGNVGIGITNPTVNLHVTNNAGTMLYPYETGVFERNSDTKLGVYCSNTGALGTSTGGASIAFGYSRLTNTNGNYPGYEIQYGALSRNDFFLRFNSLNRDAAGSVVSSVSNEMIINNGNIGINLGPVSGIPNTPTAKLHVNCGGTLSTGAVSNIRFQNLQQGAGNYLVIDANGYVRRSASGSINRVNQEDINVIKEELKSTRQELNDLKLLVNSLLENRKQGAVTNDINMNSLEIIPTPFNVNAKAIYSIADFKNRAALQILDINGALLKTIPIYQAKGQIELGNIRIASGSIIFNIISDDKVVISKKSIKE